MGNRLVKVEGVGTAEIYRGDPRLPKGDMDGWLEEMLRGVEKREVLSRPHLYGSDAGLCARRNVLLRNNTWLSEDVNAAGRGYMAIGVALENLLAEAVQRSGRLVTQNYRFLELREVKIAGKGDLVVFDSQEELAILEVKTCGELPREPKPTHLAQIQMYAAISGIHKCWLVYISRNLMPKRAIPTRTFAIETGEDALVGRLATALLSEMAIQENYLPPVPASFRKHTECHYCEFRDYFCYGTRPGMGGDAPQPPLREMTVAEYIRVENSARKVATSIYNSSQELYRATLKDLLSIPSGSIENLDRLSDLYRLSLSSA